MKVIGYKQPSSITHDSKQTSSTEQLKQTMGAKESLSHQEPGSRRDLA